MNSIVRFYSVVAPDDQGRWLVDIQRWDDDRLEARHDFIQWLFPLPEPSPVNPSAPVLDTETIQAFRERADLREALKRSFIRMILFYGFEMEEGENPVVRPSPRFQQAAANWLAPGNHNHLRITRILRATTLLGLEPYAEAFLAALRNVYETQQGRRSISVTSLQYWALALSGS